MSGQNPIKPPFNALKNALNKAAFSGKLRENLSLFDSYSYDELINLFPDRNALHKDLTEIAFQEKAAVFRKILFFFKQDEGALAAIIEGFNKDEKFTSNRSNYGDWGADPDPKDLEKKRQALQELAIELNRQDNVAQRSATANAPIPVRKFKPNTP